VHLQGFADSVRLMRLTVGGAFDAPVSLSVGGLDTAVTVTGETTVLEAARSQIAGTVPQVEIQSLPMNGRNFLDLALLIPGVSLTNIGSTQLFAETSAVPGQGISIASQRNLSNSFIVDGLSANDDAAGLSGIPYGVDTIEQFQVVTSGGQAELGRALGGYINVVTKSGTNSIHGTLYDSSVADSTYHGLHVSFVQRPIRWASVRLTYTLSKSMNDVGGAFFSSPIDSTDITRDWGRSDDDQRHRLVINGTMNTPMSPATTAWERISHGFQVSSMLQYYSALPFNITSGVANLQGTTSRPLANGVTARRTSTCVRSNSSRETPASAVISSRSTFV
jgi:hypothetical protein